MFTLQNVDELVRDRTALSGISPNVRDARCRACFKNRYGSAARGKQAARTRKAKAAK